MQRHIIKAIIDAMNYLQGLANKYKLQRPNPEAVKVGLEMSATVCAQQEEVVTTPWMKNLLVACGDLKRIKQKDGTYKTERLSIEKAGHTKAESLLANVVKAALLKFNGPERTEYNENASVFDPDHYNVDCWLQNKFGDYIFDISAGQAKERADVLKQYAVPTALTTEKVISLLQRDRNLQKAVEVVYNFYPVVTADSQIHNISSPFMKKDSNTGYPYFRNDKLKVPGMDITWGRYTLEMVAKVTNNLKDPFKALKYNTYTVWARNQRGKGRALEAQSRILNVTINSLQAPEISKLKETSQYIGLGNDLNQKEAMIKMGEFIEKHPEYSCGNWDQTGFDRHIGEGLACLSAAIRYLKCNGSLARRLAEVRYLQTQKGYCIDGANNKLTIIYGRTMSGDIDTMGQNTNINHIVDLYSNISMDPDYDMTIVDKTNYYGFYLGDDVLSVHAKNPQSKNHYTETCRKVLLDVNANKYAYGLFFLQYRVYRKDNEYKMVYPWTRVLRSMLSKENSKGLGPVGWAIAGWQQLSKLVDDMDALIPCLNIVLPLDKDGLFLDKPISWIKEQVQKEDQEALAKSKRANKTAEVLFSGNPQQERMFTDDGSEFDYDFLSNLQAKLRAGRRNSFWETLGFKTPNISKVR